eukprot:gnl/Trimastix_PCT/4552.p1 GENE.gnl/Trimastix_PCT/4552~~gnl/Trimastix_PCT/4552.p1  ORF type:complete len:308 (+),score=35.76 gnl/Trimastix_PCT/4552:40-963(+)
MRKGVFLSLLCVFFFCISTIHAEEEHSNNWAVLVCTSRFWFNYRHGANVLSMYHTVKRLGIPDSHIILMLADDFACNPRNAYPGCIFNHENHKLNLYDRDLEIDYRGYEVTIESFLRVLTGRHPPETPRSKRMLSDRNSNVLVYMTGHGGNEFLKFQDSDEISGQDIADALQVMKDHGRFKNLFFIVDTCQANTLYKRFYTQDVLAMGSARFKENSWSHHNDPKVGVSIIDRFTNAALELMEDMTPHSNLTVLDFYNSLNPLYLNSHPGLRTDLLSKPVSQIKLTDFFGSVPPVQLTRERYPLLGEP